MLACNDTITLVKCDGETYTAAVIDGVSWYDKTQVKAEGTGLVFSNAVKVRIPGAAIKRFLQYNAKPKEDNYITYITVTQGGGLKVDGDEDTEDTIQSLLPKVGDYIIRDRLPEGTTLERPADLAPFHPRKVMAVFDNLRGGLPHIALVGQ